jgi:UDP-N-acetylmuramyl tripeptide synthase
VTDGVDYAAAVGSIAFVGEKVQMGKFSCPTCDFARPELDFRATGVRVGREGVSFDVDGPAVAEKVRLKASFGGVYMVYNLLAAFAAASLAGVSPETFQATIDAYRPENGRLQHFVVDGRDVVLNLAKNPTGFNQNISLLLADERPKAVYFAINDNFNDGKDISWIWDVDFERLAGQEGLTAICGGSRAGDVRVRMKYAGIDASVANLVDGALAQVAGLPKEMPLYVLTNYSALWPAKATLERLGERHD